MIPIALKLLMPIIVIVVGTKYLIIKIDEKKKQAMYSAVLALISAVSVMLTDSIIKYVVSPQVYVSTIKGDDFLDIAVKQQKSHGGRIDSIAISYPIKGNVIKFSDISASAGIYTEADVYGDIGPDWPLNNIMIRTSVVEADINLYYKITFSPSYKKLGLQNKTDPAITTDLDKYKIVYTWHYDQISEQVIQWRMIENDKITNKPDFMISGFRFLHKTSAPAEQMIPRRTIY